MGGTVECMYQVLLCEFGYLGIDTVRGYNVVEVSLPILRLNFFSVPVEN